MQLASHASQNGSHIYIYQPPLLPIRIGSLAQVEARTGSMIHDKCGGNDLGVEPETRVGVVIVVGGESR